MKLGLPFLTIYYFWYLIFLRKKILDQESVSHGLQSHRIFDFEFAFPILRPPKRLEFLKIVIFNRNKLR